jgi:hypothetical protein
MNWNKVMVYLEQKAGEFQDLANAGGAVATRQRYDMLAEIARLLAGAIRHGMVS